MTSFAALTVLVMCATAVTATCVSGIDKASNTGAASSAGYDTSRLGPANADCKRQLYQLQISSNNIAFQNVDSNSNQVC